MFTEQAGQGGGETPQFSCAFTAPNRYPFSCRSSSQGCTHAATVMVAAIIKLPVKGAKWLKQVVEEEKKTLPHCLTNSF